MQAAKYQLIAQKRKETKERHSRMAVRAYELKAERNHLGAAVLEKLERLFIEAKWFTNYAIAEGPFAVSWKVKCVPVKAGGHVEERELKVLSSQMRQGILKRLQDNIKALAVQKRKGIKVGKIRFRREVRSIPLPQRDYTYKVLDKGHIRVQNVGILKVSGLDQIPPGAELANAVLIHRHGDCYIHITAFLPKKDEEKPPYFVGIDFGIHDQLTLSNWIKVSFEVPHASKSIRHLMRSLARKRPGSKRYRITLQRLEKEFEHLANIRKDIAYKIGHVLTVHFALIAFQDDDIHGWERLWGRKVMTTALGRLKQFLEWHGAVAVEQYYPSTQECSLCHRRVGKLPLDERTFKCPYCGAELDRDVNAAKNIAEWGLRSAGSRAERPLRPADEAASALLQRELLSVPYVRAQVASVKREASPLTAG